MPRPRLSDPPIRIHISVPSSVLAEFDLRCFDATRMQVEYGKRSQVIVQLIRDWLDRQRNGESEDGTDTEPS